MAGKKCGAARIAFAFANTVTKNKSKPIALIIVPLFIFFVNMISRINPRFQNKFKNSPEFQTLSYIACAFIFGKTGAPSGTRTPDPLIKSQLLYQLS